MNKKNGVKHLGRPADERHALIKSQVKDLLIHGYIKTTKARAKAVCQKIDSLISFVNEKNEKELSDYLRDENLLKKVMKFSTNGKISGYTSRVSIKSRAGDKAELVLVELLVK